MSSKETYKIFCQVGPRLVASLDMNGTLTIYHDHFSDEDNFQLERFIDAMDRWQVRREIQHASKRGLNLKTIEALDTLQKENPGKIYFKD